MKTMHDGRMRLAVWAVAAAVALGTAGAARAADFYVDLEWTGTEAGTQTQPYRTISNAVAAANGVSGTHNLRIAAGTYRDVDNGGLEDYSSSGLAGGGYALGVKATITANVNVYGGYSGWDGNGAEAGDFDWTEGSRVPRTTIIDLQGANSRAFANNYGHTVSTGPRFDGLTVMNGNDTGGYGGGAIIDWPPPSGNSYKMQIYINNCLFTNNVSTKGGGAVRIDGFAANAADRSWIRNSDFIGNVSSISDGVGTGGRSGGGAIAYYECNHISNCTFVANSATNYAGAVRASSIAGTIIGCAFEGNRTVLGHGGALYVYNGEVTVRESTFTGNSAPVGAAIGQNDYWGGHYTLINCLVADNTGGYAVAVGAHAGTGTYLVDLLHCTVVNNSGGGVYGYDQNANNNPIRIRNSIIANNGAYGVYRGDANDPAAEFANNDVYNNTSGNYYQCTPDANSISSDPSFAGGGDYHLAGGSPCINTATNTGLALDLQGNERPFSAKDIGIDMGCYEFDYTPPPSGTVVLIR